MPIDFIKEKFCIEKCIQEEYHVGESRVGWGR